MSKYTWLLDPGHGGIGPHGEYLTDGKQSPNVPPGIYEGEFNRDVAQRVHELMNDRGLVSQVIAPGPVNVPLKERVQYANALHDINENCIFVSIHANAMDGGWGDAEGTVAFHHPNSKAGKALAEAVVERMSTFTPISTRGVKSNGIFYVMKRTAMPAVLIECGFMTNREEATYMASDAGRTEIAQAIVSAMVMFEGKGFDQ